MVYYQSGQIKYKLKDTTNQRLAEMGFIRGTIFKIVKKVAGMFQLRTSNSSNDVVIREETEKDLDYEEYRSR